MNRKGRKKNGVLPDPIFPLLPRGPQNETIVVCPLSPHSCHHLSLFFFILHNCALQIVWIPYMIDIRKNGLPHETHAMPLAPAGCDCTCGIGLFSLVYCGVTFVLCGVVLW